MRYENTGATESSEDYLEAILVIRAERGFCRNADIAERLGVARPSVTKALAGLSSRSLVEVAGRDVRLTPEGRRLAGATLEKHEFFRRLLCDAGVDGRTVYCQALADKIGVMISTLSAFCVPTAFPTSEICQA